MTRNLTANLRWLNTYRKSEALWEMTDPMAPHVETSMGGEHVSAYFNSDVITAYPRTLDRIVVTTLVPEMKKRYLDPDWVFTYAPFGILVASACAGRLNAQIYNRRDQIRTGYVDPKNGYKTTFGIKPEETALVVSDDIYSGGGIKRTIKVLESMGVEVLPVVFTLANLSGSSNLGDREIIAGVHIEADRFKADECEMCANGSEAVNARSNWDLLQNH